MKRCFRSGSAWALVLLGLALGGCKEKKPYDLAPVSGVVKLDNQPLPDARVSFTPTGNPSGPDAYATTDAEGKYTLITVFDEKGATVGANKVSITTFKTEPDPKNPDGNPIVKSAEKVPAKYNQKTTLTFDVPKDGAEAANFDLKSGA